MKRKYDYDAILKYIREFQAERGYSPGPTAIARQFGMADPSSAQNVLDVLAIEGKIVIAPRRPREITVLSQPGAPGMISDADLRDTWRGRVWGYIRHAQPLVSRELRARDVAEALDLPLGAVRGLMIDLGQRPDYPQPKANVRKAA